MGNKPPTQQRSLGTTETGHVARKFATGPWRRNAETETDSRHCSPHEGYALTGRSMGGRRIRTRRKLASEVFFTDPRNSRETFVNFETGRNVHTELENGPSTLTAEQEERCYDPNDTTFTFVDGEDDMDFELNDYKSLRAKMSCGHTVTPTSLINWCRMQLYQGKVKFVCGLPDCNAVWPCDEVYKMALLTPEETTYIENTLFNRVKDNFGSKKCPGCMSFILRKDQNDLRVQCTMCTRNKGKNYDFCWQCLKEWTRPSSHTDHCADPECINESPLEILRKCPEITFKEVKNVTGCPSTRACPTCGLLIEHNTSKCKNMTCSRCKVEFCFVCLKLTKVCGYAFFTACISGVAPRQTSIPVWKGK